MEQFMDNTVADASRTHFNEFARKQASMMGVEDLHARHQSMTHKHTRQDGFAHRDSKDGVLLMAVEHMAVARRGSVSQTAIASRMTRLLSMRFTRLTTSHTPASSTSARTKKARTRLLSMAGLAATGSKKTASMQSRIGTVISTHARKSLSDSANQRRFCMPPVEKWKTIATHTGYEVSNRGRIRNKKTGHILSNTRTGNGYLKVNLGTGPKCTKRVNRLVAFAFLGDPPAGKVYCHHINHDPADKPG